ncbi:uncharacterized protein BXZ73DRAFT_99296 [Epithele typhae]|uniref:uncharacterized protein n=1 Tax=Epithele typhae TaxID=378194 RepID=UPI002007B013|nr:uncharacterized protein BXZ73DRAFT_99296 [Epithele typhae]KAH9939680.1 hypothetical protein BXZ73DRAFT_99296 [Epithele typhae]
MDSLRRISFATLLLASLRPALAQHAFNWGFGQNFIQTSFAECESHAINLIPLNASTTDIGQPPYYMMAFAPESTTIVSLIGDDPSQLSWQNQHPRGSKLLLTVVDGLGKIGGFPAQFYNVVAGSDTSCIPAAPSNPAVVHSNVTSLTTCDPWGLTITGGQKPYNVSLAAIDSPVITNVTMGPADDVFTFIDRADPGTQILAAVVDATGTWGISSIIVKSGGPSDTFCGGLPSTSKTTAEIQQEASDRAAAAVAAAKAKSTTIALGIVFGLIVPLILAGIAFWWWWRKNQAERGLVARPWDSRMEERAPGRPSLNVDTSVVRTTAHRQRTASWVVDAQQESPVHRTDSPSSLDMSTADLGNHGSDGPVPYLTSTRYVANASNSSITPSPSSQRVPPSAVSRLMSMERSPISHPEAAATHSSTPMTMTPMTLTPPILTPNSTSPAATLSPSQRYRKALEAHAEAQAARGRIVLGGSSSGGFQAAGPSNSAGALACSGSSTRMAAGTIPEVGGFGPDIIIQHRDGGVVEELPPPYPAEGSPRYPGLPANPAEPPRSPPRSPPYVESPMMEQHPPPTSWNSSIALTASPSSVSVLSAASALTSEAPLVTPGPPRSPPSSRQRPPLGAGAVRRGSGDDMSAAGSTAGTPDVS